MTVLERKEIYPGYQPSQGGEVFAANIKGLIKTSGLTITGVAEDLGTYPSTLSRILSGPTKKLSVDLAVGLINAVGREVDEMSDLLTSREIDNWLADHLKIFGRPGINERMGKLHSTYKQLIDLWLSVEDRVEAAKKKGEFHLLEVLSTPQKWVLRSIIEELEQNERLGKSRIVT